MEEEKIAEVAATEEETKISPKPVPEKKKTKV